MKELVSQLDYTKDTYQADFANVLKWLGETLDLSQLKEEFVKYAAVINREDDARRIPAAKTVLAGKIAYCYNRGAKLEQRSLDKITTTLDIVNSDTVLESTSDELPETAQSKAAVSYVNCYSLIDNLWIKAVDSKPALKVLADEVRTIIRKYSNSKSPILTQLKNHYYETLNDVKADKVVKGWEKPLSIVYDTIDLMLTTTKASKKTRKKSTTGIDKKAEKAASNLTYKAQDLDLGIKSIQPHAVIGAKAVVLYNTRNKHCEVYMAEDNQTLSLKGSYLLNFNQTKSCSKTLRKPQENLINWSQANNIRRLEVLLDNTPGKAKPVKGKFNQNIVIIKAIH